MHLRAFLDLPIPNIHLFRPAASRGILSDLESTDFEYKGIKEALEIEDTKVLIFGKPYAKIGRRMGVVLASGENTKIARNRADESASRIKFSYLKNTE